MEDLDLGQTEWTPTPDTDEVLDLEEGGVVEGRDWAEEELAGW